MAFVKKIVMIGDTGVGKTCLVERFVNQKVPINVVPTVGQEFFQKLIITKSGVEIAVQIWDTGMPG